ncbi:zinc finger protein 862-like [Prorops nasuta]|uniref:zinc finger protein 862-like n=1 Tax=Prorops nasuta TaxID=863751 RepID=UPI0034CE3016
MESNVPMIEEVVAVRRRDQRYRNEWETMDPYKYWLRRNVCGEKAYCIKCKQPLTPHLGVLRKHGDSQKHIDTTGLEQYREEENTVTAAVADMKVRVIKLELILTAFFVEHNIAFRIVEHLVPLLKHSFPDVQVIQKLRLGRTKISALAGVIATSYNNKLCNILRKSKFSILTDESTDASTTKVACIIVRFFDEELQRVRCAFWELIEIYTDIDSNESADSLYTNIINSFAGSNIPLENIIGFGADGCNTMMGAHNSVASRFIRDCTGITILKCICHTAHLCASYACKTLPRECEELSRNIYNFFKNSSKRQHQLKEYQILLDIDVHKMLHASQMRWLSLKLVVDRILEQWEPLKMYFTQQRMVEHSVTAETIYKSLTHPFIKCYYLFLQWVLPKFTAFNLYFQSDKVVVPLLYSSAVRFYKDMLLFYMNWSYVDNTDIWDIDPSNEHHFRSLDSIYVSILVNAELNKPNVMIYTEEIGIFRKTVLKFYIESCKKIKKRFDFNDQRLAQLECFIPAYAIDGRFHEKVQTLTALMQMFPRILDYNSLEAQSVDDEWRLLPTTQFPPEIREETIIDQFWVKIKNYEILPGHADFKNISQFVLNVLCLPHSNAECERLFSKVNLTKTKNRNKLKTTTLRNNLCSWEYIKITGTCKEFEPTIDMIDHCNQTMYNFIESNRESEHEDVSGYEENDEEYEGANDEAIDDVTMEEIN